MTVCVEHKTEAIPVLIRANRIILKSSTNYLNNITGNQEIEGTQKSHTVTADIIGKVIKKELKHLFMEII
jgi:hypothetical protein